MLSNFFQRHMCTISHIRDLIKFCVCQIQWCKRMQYLVCQINLHFPEFSCVHSVGHASGLIFLWNDNPMRFLIFCCIHTKCVVINWFYLVCFLMNIGQMLLSTTPPPQATLLITISDDSHDSNSNSATIFNWISTIEDKSSDQYD